MSAILAPIGVFGVHEYNCGSTICLRPTTVAMVTKILNFDSKFAITRFIQEVCATRKGAP